jgi:hypothetical protein
MEERKGSRYKNPYIDLHDIIKERVLERNISSMHTRGDILIEGVTLVPIMSSKRKKKGMETKRKNICMKTTRPD